MNWKCIGTSVVVAVLALGIGWAVGAQGPRGGSRGGDIARMDANGDGTISQSEWTGGAEAFTRLDTNSDGSLTREELASARGGRGGFGRGMANMDANNDGRVSRDEFRGPAEAFDRLDANSDGYLSSEEMPRGRGPGFAGGGPRDLSTMDANSDGKISREEWTGPAEAFSRMDANGDGSIAADEMRPPRRPRN